MSNPAFTQILLNGRIVSIDDIINFRLEPFTDFEHDIFLFTREWFSQIPSINFKTSGSTGIPKIIQVKKEQIKASITATANALDLKPNDKALLCIPVANTGGKMMLARAFKLGMILECVEPSNDPLEKAVNIPDFMAIVPLQLQNIIQRDSSKEKLNHCQKIIVGGAPVEHDLIENIQSISASIYATYGMTETVSHIALKLLNTPNRQYHYHALPGVKLEIDERDCLRIKGDITGNRWIQTNDRVILISPGEFEWIGRSDFVINSGGFKIQPEEVEKKLKSIFSHLEISRSYFIYGQPDKNLGMKCALLIEGEPIPVKMLEKLKKLIDEYIPTMEKPRIIAFVDEFVYTESGKRDRRKTINKLRY